MTAANHTAAVGALMDWIEARFRPGELTAVGHRVVHGGPKYSEPQRITPKMVEELHQLQPLDPEHLPEEILLTGRHGFFSCYEAFIHIIDSMFNQHAKWLEVTRHIPWRRQIASLNYLLSSHV